LSSLPEEAKASDPSLATEAPNYYSVLETLDELEDTLGVPSYSELWRVAVKSRNIPKSIPCKQEKNKLHNPEFGESTTFIESFAARETWFQDSYSLTQVQKQERSNLSLS